MGAALRLDPSEAIPAAVGLRRTQAARWAGAAGAPGRRRARARVRPAATAAPRGALAVRGAGAAMRPDDPSRPGSAGADPRPSWRAASRACALPAPPAARACRAGPPRTSRAHSTSTSGGRRVQHPPDAPCGRRSGRGRRGPGPRAAARSAATLPGSSSGRAVSTARIGGPRPALSPSKHRIGSSAMRQSRPSWSGVSAVPSGAPRCREARRDHGDDVDIALDGDHRAAVVGRLAGEVVVVEHDALVEERRLRRIQVLGRDVLRQRPPAEGDHPARAGRRSGTSRGRGSGR